MGVYVKRKPKTFICVLCGAEIVQVYPRKYCDACRRKMKNENDKKRTEQKRKAEREAHKAEIEAKKAEEAERIAVRKAAFTLTEVCAAAEKNGMTYGRYVAAWKAGQVAPPERIEKKKKKRGRPCKDA